IHKRIIPPRNSPKASYLTAAQSRLNRWFMAASAAQAGVNHRSGKKRLTRRIGSVAADRGIDLFGMVNDRQDGLADVALPHRSSGHLQHPLELDSGALHY